MGSPNPAGSGASRAKTMEARRFIGSPNNHDRTGRLRTDLAGYGTSQPGHQCVSCPITGHDQVGVPVQGGSHDLFRRVAEANQRGGGTAAELSATLELCQAAMELTHDTVQRRLSAVIERERTGSDDRQNRQLRALCLRELEDVVERLVRWRGIVVGQQDSPGHRLSRLSRELPTSASHRGGAVRPARYACRTECFGEVGIISLGAVRGGMPSPCAGSYGESVGVANFDAGPAGASSCTAELADRPSVPTLTGPDGSRSLPFGGPAF